MMRAWLIAVAVAVATTSSANAQALALFMCLRDHVSLSDAAIGPDNYGRLLEFDITNTMTTAIAGVYFEVVAHSDGRTVPWFKDTMSVMIPGGVEPGETRHLDGYQVMVTSDAPEDLIVTLEVLDVFDYEERAFLGDVLFVGRPSEPSPLACP